MFIQTHADIRNFKISSVNHMKMSAIHQLVGSVNSHKTVKLALKMKFSKFVSLVILVSILIESISGQILDVITNYGNQFLSNVGLSNGFDSNNGNNYEQPAQNSPQTPQIVQRYPQSPSYLSSCAPYFSHQTGFFGYGTKSGQLEIPNLDRMQNDIRAVMTVATRLSVEYFIPYKMLMNHTHSTLVSILRAFICFAHINMLLRFFVSTIG